MGGICYISHLKQAVYFISSNLIRFVSDQFKHPQKGFFKYFSLNVLGKLPECYHNISPRMMVGCEEVVPMFYSDQFLQGFFG